MVRNLPLEKFSVRKYLSIRGELGRREYRTVLAYVCRAVLGEEFLIKCSQDKNELSRISRIRPLQRLYCDLMRPNELLI